MPRLFGTDGVRGLANGTLTADLALGLAQAAAAVLTRGRSAEARRAAGKRPLAIVARDPRVSGEFLSSAVAAGLASSGIDVYDAGVIPTPATAFLIADFDADFGVMVSASHNPAPDNGIKIFARGGTKLPDVVEDRIEQHLDMEKLTPTGADVGRIRRFADAEDRYVVHLLASLPHRLDGIHVVLDCAHGAAAGISPEVFTDAGARVTVIGDSPDGMNINDGVGSTHLDKLAEAVLAAGADVGIAHDGDADRCLAIDADGNIVDGDQIMAILAVGMKERGKLTDDTLVATVMSNLGLKIAMRENGIRIVETAVGDRYVLEEMNQNDYALGGEQSGHVIMREFATTERDGTSAQAALGAGEGDDGLPAGHGEREGRRPPRRAHRRAAPAGRSDRGGGTRRQRPRAPAPVRHRTARARHGGGRRPHHSGAPGERAGRRGAGAARGLRLSSPGGCGVPSPSGTPTR